MIYIRESDRVIRHGGILGYFGVLLRGQYTSRKVGWCHVIGLGLAQDKRANMLAWVIPHGMHITGTPWALVGQEVLIDKQLRC